MDDRYVLDDRRLRYRVNRGRRDGPASANLHGMLPCSYGSRTSGVAGMTPEASIGRPSAMGMPTTTVRGEPPCRRPTPVVALPAEALDETPTVSAVCGSLPHTAQTAEPLQRKPCLVQGTDDATTNGATSRALVQSARAACPRHRGAPISNQGGTCKIICRRQLQDESAPAEERGRPVAKSHPRTPSSS